MINYRKALVAGAFLGAAAMVTPAMAADPGYWDQPTAAFNWSGFYAGIQGGGGWAHSTLSDVTGSVTQRPSGGYIGGYVAGLVQHDWAVFGAEAELNYGWMRRSAAVSATSVVGQRLDWFGSLNAVVGIPLDRVLVYATGGLAFASIGNSQSVPGASYSASQGTAGWTLGAGMDFAVTDDIVVGGRYRYYDFGRNTFTPGAPFTQRTQRTSLHTIGARVAVKF